LSIRLSFVKDGGLDKFYEIRKGYIPGSIKKIKVDEDLFVNDIKRINEKPMKFPYLSPI